MAYSHASDTIRTKPYQRLHLDSFNIDYAELWNEVLFVIYGPCLYSISPVVYLMFSYIVSVRIKYFYVLSISA